MEGETRKIRVELEIPAGMNTRSFISDLQSWLCRRGALVTSWGPPERRFLAALDKQRPSWSHHEDRL